jgi:hypothetical protein
MTTRLLPSGAAALALLVLAAPVVRAERVRYHLTPADLSGITTLTPPGNCFAVGEHVSYFGLGTKPYYGSPRPTVMTTFCNPVTGGNVMIPLALPDSTPLMRHAPNRIIFDYGTYYVEVHFLSDGSVDVIYDNGLLRRLL